MAERTILTTAFKELIITKVEEYLKELLISQANEQLRKEYEQQIFDLKWKIAELEAELKEAKKSESSLLNFFKPVFSKKVEVVNQEIGKKRALLCGLNYTGTENELRGCQRDVELVSSLLIGKYSYSEESVSIKIDPDLIGEKDVLDYLKDVALSAQTGETIFFHYSGHGTFIKDIDGDEKDGFDEAIYTRKGLVIDDKIAKVFQLFPAGVKVFAIFDCCNSGSIVDLPYRYRGQGAKIEVDSDKKFEADIIVLSGCLDSQLSSDAWIKERNNFYGALTANVAKLVETGRINKLTWYKLIDALQVALKNQKFKQIPQISTNKKELLKQLVQF